MSISQQVLVCEILLLAFAVCLRQSSWPWLPGRNSLWNGGQPGTNGPPPEPLPHLAPHTVMNKLKVAGRLHHRSKAQFPAPKLIKFSFRPQYIALVECLPINYEILVQSPGPKKKKKVKTRREIGEVGDDTARWPSAGHLGYNLTVFQNQTR